ncbi:carboxypeptidase-like regulatory domain-containing protein, partial [uncultured Weeksella sp.]
MNKIILLYIFLLSSFCNAQSFIGHVRDETGFDLPNVSVLLKNPKTSLVNNFTTTQKNGTYALNSLIDFDSIHIEFKKTGYVTEFIKLSKEALDIENKLNIVLYKSDFELKEVLVKGQKAVYTKNDTTFVSSPFFQQFKTKQIMHF